MQQALRITRYVVLIACYLLCQSLMAQTFVDVTIQAGITHNAIPPGGPTAPTFNQVQSGGAAAGDFDNDGWVDLYVTRYFDTDLLYRNNRDGTFTDVTAVVFGDEVLSWQTNGAAWGDIDNDGDLDLAVATFAESRHLLFLNDGVGHLTEVGSCRNVIISDGLKTTAGASVSMGDYDRDGYLDLYFAAWRDFSTVSNPVHSRLFRNVGLAMPGQFEDVTADVGVAMDLASGIHSGRSLAFTPRFVDFDLDGNTDIGIASDGGTSRLFWGNGQGSFDDGTDAAGIFTGTNDMGFSVGDFNGDGLMDWFVTSIGTGAGNSPSGNRLFLNNGDRTFSDATDLGVREGGWGWGTEAFDFDNDGDLDIAMTNGMTIAADDQSMLFENVGSRQSPQFVNRSDFYGIADARQGRGLLTFDYDRDGDLDLFIVNYNSSPILYRNDVATENSRLQLKTIGTASNRNGLGARVTLTPDINQPERMFIAEIQGNSSYLSQSESLAHIGLGDAKSIDRMVIEWPSGNQQVRLNVAINQRITIIEGSDDALLGDVNGDNAINLLDVAPFSSLLLGNDFQLEADINLDGFVNSADVAPFIELLFAG